MLALLASGCSRWAFGLGTAFALIACSKPRAEPVVTRPDAGSDMACEGQSSAAGRCSDLPPVPQIHFQVTAPKDAADYPFGPGALPVGSLQPEAPVYLTAAGSADPEGLAINAFWNVQDPSSAYLAIAPDPAALRVSFTPPRIGRYTITLEVTEAQGLRQIAQASLVVEVAPHPCAADGVSPPCSNTLPVPGGAFVIGSPDGVGDESERPEHPGVVASFSLDEYEVTVGRFRRFLANYDPTLPAPGAGAHPRIAGSGWLDTWNKNLPGSRTDFDIALSECGGPWTNEPGANEARPVSCVTWYEAFAFCVSEGKRLPTEAEWEYAAAGGAEQRTYPWGSEAPSVARAVYGCSFDGEPACSDADLPFAGSVPTGAGRFGQLDLAGSVWEWVLDSYAPYSLSADTGAGRADTDAGASGASGFFGLPGAPRCDNCANLSDPEARVFRGSGFSYDAPSALRAASRYGFDPAYPDQTRGVRCASD